MIKDLSFKYISSLLILFISACSDSFSNPVLMPVIDLGEVEILSKPRPMIYLQEVGDLRSNKKFLSFDNQFFETHADIGPVVREVLSKVLVESGFKYSNNAKVIFKVNVVKWESLVKSGLISDLDSVAELQLNLFQRNGKKIYTGKYVGEAKVQSSSLSNEELSKSLGLAMREAVMKISQDASLVKLIESNK